MAGLKMGILLNDDGKRRTTAPSLVGPCRGEGGMEHSLPCGILGIQPPAYSSSIAWTRSRQNLSTDVLQKAQAVGTSARHRTVPNYRTRFSTIAVPNLQPSPSETPNVCLLCERLACTRKFELQTRPSALSLLCLRPRNSVNHIRTFKNYAIYRTYKAC